MLVDVPSFRQAQGKKLWILPILSHLVRLHYITRKANQLSDYP